VYEISNNLHMLGNLIHVRLDFSFQINMIQYMRLLFVLLYLYIKVEVGQCIYKVNNATHCPRSRPLDIYKHLSYSTSFLKVCLNET